MARLGGERAVDGDDVGVLEELLEANVLSAEFLCDGQQGSVLKIV